MTIRTLTLFVLPLGLLAAACSDSPTSPSSASNSERAATTASGTPGLLSGTNASGTATNGQAFSSSNASGTATGAQAGKDAAAANASGANGFALRFAPTGGGELGRVRVPIEPQVPLDVANDFTIEFWVKAEPGANAGGSCQAGEDGWRFGNVILDRHLTGGPDYGEYGLSMSGGRIAFGVATTRGSQTICGLIDVSDGRWHHVAATRRAADGQLRVYVDGTESAQGAGPTGDASYRDGRESTLNALDPLLQIGGSKQDDGRAPPGFTGWLDELRVSNRVRYTAPFDRATAPFTTDADTVALYHFDDGPLGPCTSTVLDSSGHGTHGQCRQGGLSAPTPAFVTDTPFNVLPQKRPSRTFFEEDQ